MVNPKYGKAGQNHLREWVAYYPNHGSLLSIISQKKGRGRI
jgi:hypothetical protein